MDIKLLARSQKSLHHGIEVLLELHCLLCFLGLLLLLLSTLLATFLGSWHALTIELLVKLFLEHSQFLDQTLFHVVLTLLPALILDISRKGHLLSVIDFLGLPLDCTTLLIKSCLASFLLL